MRKAIDICCTMKVTAINLLELDRFNLQFTDGTSLTATLRQLKAIRLIPASLVAPSHNEVIPLVA